MGYLGCRLWAVPGNRPFVQRASLKLNQVSNQVRKMLGILKALDSWYLSVFSCGTILRIGLPMYIHVAFQKNVFRIKIVKDMEVSESLLPKLPKLRLRFCHEIDRSSEYPA